MKIEILTALLSAMSLSRSPLASASSKLFSSSRKHSKEQHHQQEEVYDTTMATSISSSTKARLSSNTDHRFLQVLGMTWQQVGSDIDGEGAGDQSGYSVAVSGDGMRVIVGALYNDANGDNSGYARVYKEVDGNWFQVGSDLDGEAAGDESGWSVAMSGDGMRVIVGAPRNDANGVESSGHARVYKEVGGNWVQVGSDLDGEATYDLSGWSVAMSGDGMRVIVGAPWNDANGDDSGRIRVYKEVDGNWFQVGSDLDGEAGQSGWSVAISGDRMRVIVGAPYNGNGAWSGHARVYKEVDGNWVQVGSDLDGEAAYDLSGYSVAISGDGMRVIVGAPHLNDANGFRSDSGGHARVFQLLLVPPTDQPSSSAVSWSLNTNALIGLSFASVFLVLDGGLF
jgi:hypothetical protein